MIAGLIGSLDLTGAVMVEILSFTIVDLDGAIGIVCSLLADGEFAFKSKELFLFIDVILRPSVCSAHHIGVFYAISNLSLLVSKGYD